MAIWHDPFHGRDDVADWARVINQLDRVQTFSYRFHTHIHPHVATLVKALVEDSVPGLQAQDTGIEATDIFTRSRCNP